MSNNKPKFLLAENLPEIASFENSPAEARRLENEFNGKPSISFLYDIDHAGVKKVWFATNKQQAKLLTYDIVIGKEYKIIKSKPAGEQWPEIVLQEIDTGNEINRVPGSTNQTKKQQQVLNSSNKTITVRYDAAAWSISAAIEWIKAMQDENQATESNIEDYAKKILAIQERIAHS